MATLNRPRVATLNRVARVYKAPGQVVPTRYREIIQSKGLSSMTEDQLVKVDKMNGVSHYMYSDMVINWIQQQFTLTQAVIDRVWSTIDISKLNTQYVVYLKHCIRSSGYLLTGKCKAVDDGRSLFHDSPLVMIPRRKLKILQRTLSIELVQAKCPVVTCPEYGKIVIVKFVLNGQAGSIPSYQTQPLELKHTSGISHQLSHWYCLAKKDSDWIFVSFMADGAQRAMKKLLQADEVWMGMLVKDRGYREIILANMWQYYTNIQMYNLRRLEGLDHLVYIDLMVTWIQQMTPTQNTVAGLWSAIEQDKTNELYLKMIRVCLFSRGYKVPELNENLQYKYCGDKKTAWAQVSSKQIAELRDCGTIKLEFKKCPVASCWTQLEKDAWPCSATFTMNMKEENNTPCYTRASCKLVHEANGCVHKISHWYCIIQGMKYNFVSFHIQDRANLVELLKLKPTANAYFGFICT